MGTQDCFFYQQKCFRENPKRCRKLPEDLPESLKFAHLNPKVAALLASKEKQQKQEELNMVDGFGKKSLMPDINSTLQNIKNQLDMALSNDEDSQRYLFDEAKVSSGSVLEQLSKLIYRYQNIVYLIPKSLEYQLLATYKELVSDIIFVAREWQTIAMRDHYSKLSDNNSEDDYKMVVDEDIKPARPPLESGKHKKKQGTKVGLPEITEDDHKNDKTRQSVIQSNRQSDSKNSITTSRATKSRADRGGSAIQRSPGLKRGTIHEGEKMSHHGDSPQEMRNFGNPHYMSVIHFELSSKMCEDKGWIMNRGSEMEIEREKLLEWCIHILQQSLKKIKEQQEKEQGLDKPIQVRYYGDTRIETLIKYRKSPIKQEVNPALRGHKPCIPSMFDDKFEGKTLMLSGHSDGTTVVYYPSGRPAVVYSAAGFGRPGYYTLVYDDVEDLKMLACFTPKGIGCVYHSNGVIWFLSTSSGGHLAEKDGSVQKKWKWPTVNMKIQSPISLQLNNWLGFRCIAQSQMAIYYNNERESAKFLVSPVNNAVEVKHGDENEQLLTTFGFTSNAARDMLRLFAPKSKLKLKKKKEKYSGELAEMQKILDYPEVTMYGTQAEKDLARLQRKAKNLIDDWMEHYRIAVGLTSPSLNDIQELPISRRRYAQSAKMSSKDSVSRGATLGIDFNEKSTFKSHRAPSAPTGQMKRPSTSCSISPSRQGAISSVKFDEVPETNDAGGDGEIMSPSALAVMNRLISASSPTRSRSTRSKSSIKQQTQATPLDGSLCISSCDTCPVILRQRMAGISNVYCRCSRYNISTITDFEFDIFITKVVPNAQLQIVVIVSSLFPNSNHALEMIEKMYTQQNRNRMRPCPQCHSDTERFLKYDINTAAANSNHTQPLLLTRHNAVPGMILIYSDGNLLFCDHIFNGYGNTKKDFKKQITKSRLDAIHGIFLPKDFRFSPSQGHHGPRSAWGGEIGGAGVDSHGSPGTTKDDYILHRSSSGLTLDGHVPSQLRRSENGLNYLMNIPLWGRGMDTAHFICMSLSPMGYRPHVEIANRIRPTTVK